MGKHQRNTPEMNVTPLVDVVLVLLIIFMVVTPLLSKQFWLQLPKQETEAAPPSGNKSVVLTVKKDGVLALNGASIDKKDLRDKMSRIMAARSDKVLYFDAEDDAPYASTVEAMDIARQGGAKTIAVLTSSVIQ
ncbi:MAG: biopolymer transporter ExbD [Labilithrix sp.]|nr:biopolymer transporter ExbD [Labilithrix sp.]MCW5812775.1 biopolymer transporter ExbD [Labilithrix sp.]